MVVVGDGLLSIRGAFKKIRPSIEIHSMKFLCQTSEVMMAFRYSPFWNPETPKKILGFNPMELDFEGCPQLVRLGLLLCFPQKKKQTNKPMILCVHFIGFYSKLPINQSINQFKGPLLT
jgi:hypothetical protein